MACGLLVFAAPLLLALVALWAAQEDLSPRKRVYTYEVGMDEPPLDFGFSAPPELMETRFTQKLDHFNEQDTRTWQQRYFVSDKHHKPGHPAILYLSGEGPADGTNVNNGLLGELAARLGALTIDLEHRFYGKSHPTPDTSGPSLAFLSTEQALADIAHFAVSFRRDSGYEVGRWLLMGGSYAGTLATWARAHYPHLFHVAYASSAPLLAKLGFSEFHEEAEKGLSHVDPKCPQVIRQAMAELDLLVAQQEGRLISAIFELCEAELNTSCAEDVWNLEFLISNVVSSVRRDVACHQLLHEPGTALQLVAKLVLYFAPPGDCVVSSYRDTRDKFRLLTEWPAAEFNIVRPWYYQMCSQLGWQFTLSSQNQPYGQRLPWDFYQRWCQHVYEPGISRAATEAGIARTNLLHGGLTTNVTRVLFTHGSLDPWHRLGVTWNLGPDTLAIVIQGATHVEDVSPPLAQDSPALLAARRRIIQILTSWML